VTARPPRLVAFDFDGTLADTFGVFHEVFDDVVDRYALRRPAADDVPMLRRMTNAEVLRWLEVPLVRLPAILRFARARMAERAHEIALFPGVDPLVRALARAGTRVAVVTSNGESAVRAVLGDALCVHLHAFRCGVGLFGKAPRLRALARRSGIAPHDIVLVGDEERDVAAARDAGVRSVAVSWGYAAPEALAQADAVCATVDELARHLGLPVTG
jgi:phosphoglycolate phosphatase